MMIKILNEHKIITCDVANEKCEGKICLVAHKYIHHNKALNGDSITWQDKHYSCANRNYHGCPEVV